MGGSRKGPWSLRPGWKGQFGPLVRRSLQPRVCNVGAFTITNAILGVPYYKYSRIYHIDPILIINAPALVVH